MILPMRTQRPKVIVIEIVIKHLQIKASKLKLSMELARSRPKQRRTRRKERRISKVQRELVTTPPKVLMQKLRRKRKFNKLKSQF